MASQFLDMTSSPNFFDVVVFFLLRLVTYFKFNNVNIITGSGVMTIFVYKGLIRNPEIENTHIWILPNIRRLGWVKDTKFGTSVSNEKLLNAAKCQGYSFYLFWVIKGKATGGGGGGITPHPYQG